MENYVIPDLMDLDLMHLAKGNRYFCLANFYVKDEKYRAFFLNLKKYHPEAFITLDCGSAEKDTVTMTEYIDVTAELMPNEVLALDILFDKKATLDSFYEFIRKLDNHPKRLLNKVNIFACPQGSNKEEYLECYETMVRHPLVKTIGLSKIAVPKAFLNKTGDEGIKEARHICINELTKLNLLLKPIHFLGMGDPTEFEYYKTLNNPLLRSTDSCYTVLAGKNNILFDEGNFTRIKTTNDFYHQKLSNEERERAIRNIEWFKKHL